ncbi:hypothetical protein [Nesterenkonia sandarakina]|uniref:Uncharacterized protein n=1 Tax=Nesterenkonia sandarakina TaxID=272918 RepID=A0A2T0YIQ2_9MICC|nr:hypothetical protein [Nesterenkonia sandarakina]PRZ15084.1 hypothetical protein BCL67_1093 [Nesterenkonia sandarakina]
MGKRSNHKNKANREKKQSAQEQHHANLRSWGVNVPQGILMRQKSMMLAAHPGTWKNDRLHQLISVADVLSWAMEFPELNTGDALLKAVEELGAGWKTASYEASMTLGQVYRDTGSYDREEAFKRVLASF